jgi:hypothetical protein
MTSKLCEAWCSMATSGAGSAPELYAMANVPMSGIRRVRASTSLNASGSALVAKPVEPGFS